MSVESSPVVIRIEVADGAAGTTIAAIETSLRNLGKAGTQAGSQLSSGVGTAIPGLRWSMRSLGEETRKLSGHFQTNFDSVRLLRTEMGVMMPRAMESMIARSEALMGVISGLNGLLVAGGAAMIAYSAAKEVYNLYERWIDVDGAVRQYEQSAASAAQQKLFDDGGLESQISALKILDAQVDDLTAKKKKYYEIATATPEGGLTALLTGNWFSTGQAQQLGTLLGQKQQQDLRQMEERYRFQQRQREIDMKREEARAPEAQRAAIERKYADLRSGDEQSFTFNRDTYLANVWNQAHPEKRVEVPGDDGLRAAQQATDDADANFNLKQVDRQRQASEEMRRIHEQAIESSLSGEALYAQKAKFDSDELTTKWRENGVKRKEIEAGVADVQARYDNERLERIRQQTLATEEIQMRAAMVGMGGLARSEGEGEVEIGRTMADKSLPESTRSARVAAIHAQTNAEMVQQEREFASQMDSISDSAASHQVSGFARIRAEAQKQLDDVKKHFDDLTRGNDMKSPFSWYLYAGAAQRASGAQAAVRAGANSQSADLAKRNEEETEQIESQARAKLLSSEKQKTAAIDEEYKERVRKYQDALDQQEISQDDFNRRVAAAQMEAQAELQEQAQATRQKIAGELSGLFGAHPLEALQRLGEKYAGEAASSMMSHVFTASGTPGTSAGGGWKTEGLTALLGHVGSGHPAFGGATQGAAAMQSFASAEIHVGQAAIMLGGFGGGGGAAMGSTSAGMAAASRGFSAGGFSGMGVGAGINAGSFTSSSPAMSSGGGAGSVLGNVTQGIGTARSLYSMFHSGSGATAGRGFSGMGIGASINAGSYNLGSGATSAYGSSMMGGGFTASNVAGAAGGALGLFSAYKEGGAGGMMSGAMSGAKLGMAVGGPIGAGVGAAVGLALGAFGGGEQARLYWERQGRPRLQADMFNYQTNGDYLGAMSDIQALSQEAKRALDKMGMTGDRYWSSTADPELQAAKDKLNREQRAGRSASTFSAAQFALGTDYVPRDGMAMIHEGERITPSDQNERITRAVESMSGGPRMATAAEGAQFHLHVHAIDAKSFTDTLMDNADGVRAALNHAFGNYGGLADAGI